MAQATQVPMLEFEHMTLGLEIPSTKNAQHVDSMHQRHKGILPHNINPQQDSNHKLTDLMGVSMLNDLSCTIGQFRLIAL